MRLLAAAVLVIALAVPAGAQSNPPLVPAVERGDAVRYASPGGLTASGEPYSPERFTAAHPTLPFGTLVEVVFRDRSITVRVNDRDTGGAAVRLSGRAADQLGLPPGGGQVELRLDPGELAYLEARARRLAAAATSPTEYSTTQYPAGGGLQGAAYYSIQLAAFTDRNRAAARAGEHRGAWIEAATVDGRPIYRVLYGRYDSPDAASRVRDDLRGRGVDGFVQRLAPEPRIAPAAEGSSAPEVGDRPTVPTVNTSLESDPEVPSIERTAGPAGASNVVSPEAGPSPEPARQRRAW